MPSGPSGRPTSEEVSTSLASWASPAPSCEPKAMPPTCEIIPSIGPAIWRASSGRPSTQAPATRCATGSHRRCQVGMVVSTHCAGDQTTTCEVPDGRVVASSSHSSARRTDSSAARCCSLVGLALPSAPSCWCAICAASL